MTNYRATPSRIEYALARYWPDVAAIVHATGAKPAQVRAEMARLEAINAEPDRMHGPETCPAGHPYDEGNVRWKRNTRVCKICDRTRNLARYHLKRAS